MNNPEDRLSVVRRGLPCNPAKLLLVLSVYICVTLCNVLQYDKHSKLISNEACRTAATKFCIIYSQSTSALSTFYQSRSSDGIGQRFLAQKNLKLIYSTNSIGVLTKAKHNWTPLLCIHRISYVYSCQTPEYQNSFTMTVASSD